MIEYHCQPCQQRFDSWNGISKCLLNIFMAKGDLLQMTESSGAKHSEIIMIINFIEYFYKCWKLHPDLHIWC